MKKLLALCLTIVLCLCCLASCGSAYEENTWFSEEKLTQCLVGDLPKIEKDFSYMLDRSFVLMLSCIVR